MANTKQDEVVLDTLRQVIKEVKQEMKTKKVLTESKTPQQVFDRHQKDLYNYIVENVSKVIMDAKE